jgi:hypothetical protein
MLYPGQKIGYFLDFSEIGPLRCRIHDSNTGVVLSPAFDKHPLTRYLSTIHGLVFWTLTIDGRPTQFQYLYLQQKGRLLWVLMDG